MRAPISRCLSFSVSATLANVREMSSRLGAETGELAQLLGEGRDTLAALRKAADSTAALADERGFLNPGDTVAFLGIGSGLNCMMLGIEW